MQGVLVSDIELEERFKQLLGLLLDDEITEEQLNELTEIVKTSPEHSKELRLQLMMASELEQSENPLHQSTVFSDAVMLTAKGEGGDDPFIMSVMNQAKQEDRVDYSESTSINFKNAFLAIAALLIVGFFIFLSKPTNEKIEMQLGYATMIETVDALFDHDLIKDVGAPIKNQTISLVRGYAEIKTEIGVNLILEGPVEFSFVPDDPLTIKLHYGALFASVPPAAVGFSILTEEAKVVDLGTEFGVRYEKDSGTSIQVYKGEVIAGKKTEQKLQHLGSGEGLHISKNKNIMNASLEFRPERFIRYLPDTRELGKNGKYYIRRNEPYNILKHNSINIGPVKDIKIDGNLSDWDLSHQIESHAEPPFKEFYDLKANMAYDSDYLYLGAEVGDPLAMRNSLSPTEHEDMFGRGGCIALRLSTDRKMGWPVKAKGAGLTSATKRDLEEQDLNEKLVFAVLWYYEPEKLPCLDLRYGMDRGSVKTNPEGYKGAYKKHQDGLGYTIEYAIPWSLLNAAEDPPQGGDSLGCVWLTHWSGPEGKVWHGQLIEVKNPSIDEWSFQDAETWGKAHYLK